MLLDLIVIGGGAAGFFTAIRLAEQVPSSRILILEKSNKLLSKVKVSGGGRCNVTHACFDPKEMIDHYPRGSQELLGPFHRFLCGDMMEWLEERGVPTKIESDGRVFPVTDRSQTIIDCFLEICSQRDIMIRTSEAMQSLSYERETWVVSTLSGNLKARRVMIATGSTPSVWKILGAMGLKITPPVPSLFTFNIKHRLLEGLMGLSVPAGLIRITDSRIQAEGPILITHWGLSGPAVLRLSAWAARELNEVDYAFQISVDWSGQGRAAVSEILEQRRHEHGRKKVKAFPLEGFARRFWERICEQSGIREENFASLSRQKFDRLVGLVTECRLEVSGKSTFKEEFVTCGGVDRKELDFKTMQSKQFPGLYFAGEVIDIDAITGGFNFQAAWTEAYIAAEDMAAHLES